MFNSYHEEHKQRSASIKHTRTRALTGYVCSIKSPSSFLELLKLGELPMEFAVKQLFRLLTPWHRQAKQPGLAAPGRTKLLRGREAASRVRVPPTTNLLHPPPQPSLCLKTNQKTKKKRENHPARSAKTHKPPPPRTNPPLPP